MSSRNGIVVTTAHAMYQANERGLLLYHKKTLRDGTAPGLVMIHGHQNPSESWLLDDLNRDDWPQTVAADAGYICVAQQSGSFFGNDTAIAYVQSAYTYLTTARGTQGSEGGGAKTGKIALMGFSHGASSVLNWARANPTLVSAIALACPLVDIEDVRANNRAGFQTAIETAWGGNANWQTARPNRNPVEFASQLASIPIFIAYGGADFITVPDTMTAFATAHGNTTLHNMGAEVSHDPTYIPFETTAEFLKEHAP